MTWVKICGITNIEDALTAVESGVDALGFVFYAKSPRNISPSIAGKIVAKLLPQVERVGVFVNESVEHIDDVVKEAGLTAVQLYGEDCALAFVEHLRVSCAGHRKPKVISVIPAEKLTDPDVFIAKDLGDTLHALLIDSGSAAKPGGTGECFDWEKTKDVIEMLGYRHPTIIAGGLNATNVEEAIEAFHPWGVDVSSGVEAKPGKKDAWKIRDFIASVRRKRRVV